MHTEGGGEGIHLGGFQGSREKKGEVPARIEIDVLGVGSHKRQGARTTTPHNHQKEEF